MGREGASLAVNQSHQVFLWRGQAPTGLRGWKEARKVLITLQRPLLPCCLVDSALCIALRVEVWGHWHMLQVIHTGASGLNKAAGTQPGEMSVLLTQKGEA